ncbi:dienelactone hydrolase family protein [Polaromonas sp.]|uniref:dienelactone hydrolase family protein n=1 Tax=Polaromonas sp. TaxID=1869339 RepID=UPI0027318514|nr:CocE/NonD family hydrolase [Polaromonas sp.]MDP2449981.1 CocE/NonD family hydrolase [Polaromonas sp.]MDP3294172.1 CocE/NonD family hydrolase [Nevskia sp.]MDP3754736.1 CocE/NonD family hydrolase [Polaromonas sp.]
MNLKTLFLVAALLGAALSPAAAQSGDLDASLNETVVQIPKAGSPAIALETTVYKPEGEGPFPVAIINHGKAYGKAREQARYRPAIAARYFLQRGYAVIVPMRQGFSNSGGNYAGAGCDVEGNGLAHAGDVKAALDYVTAQPWADKGNIVVLGQSHGGWTTLAFGSQAYPGVKALVNFAGGLRQEKCPGWEQALALGAGRYARDTRLPSLWFYGDNDSYFSTHTFRAMHAQYTAAGGQARLVAFGEFGSDAHHLFGSRAGQPVWQPEVSRLLAAVGLPSERQAKFAKYGTAGLTPLPPETDFAALENVIKLPHVKSAGRAGYQAYLMKMIPRAFAIGPDGAWGWADGGEDPLKRALHNCQRHSKGECRLYSVDDFVVWQ